MRRSLIALCLAFVLAGGGLLVYVILQSKSDSFGLLLGIYITMSIMLTALPLLICYAQTTSIARQISKLETLCDRGISNTEHFRIAMSTLRSINPSIIEKYYTLPILSFAFVVLYCWIMTTTAYLRPDYFSTRNVILGGMFVLQQLTKMFRHTNKAPSSPAALASLVPTFMFSGAYLTVSTTMISIRYRSTTTLHVCWPRPSLPA